MNDIRAEGYPFFIFPFFFFKYLEISLLITTTTHLGALF